VFSGVFTAQEGDEEGYKGSGDTTMVDVQTLLEAFLIMSLRFARFIGQPFFPGKKQLFLLGTDLKCWFIRISGLTNVGMKEFYCKCNVGHNIPHKDLCSFRRHMCNLKCSVPNYTPSRIALISE
jgi:hypothetical protein